MNTSIAFQRSQEDIYQDKRVAALAESCKAGSAASMKEMAYFFRNRCTQPLIDLLNRYEENPSADLERTIDEYLRKNFYEENTAAAYMMWLVRAAYYGDQQTGQFLSKYPYYKRKAFIPQIMLEEDHEIDIWASNFLYKVGFIDVVERYEDCSLRFDSRRRQYILIYVSDYDPADDDGFGAEWKYGKIYFDEFFNRIS